jgi:hypothetical protein
MAQRLAEPIRNAEAPSVGQPARLPPDVEAELEALTRLNDDVLWAVARSRMESTRQRRWHRLLEKNQRNTLTESERQDLARLSADGDRLTLCKAQAYLLLKERGYPIPEIE